MSKPFKFTLIIILVIAFIVITYLAWTKNYSYSPGQPNDYFSCLEAGGAQGVAPGTEGTSLSSCNFMGKWYSYDG